MLKDPGEREKPAQTTIYILASSFLQAVPKPTKTDTTETSNLADEARRGPLQSGLQTAEGVQKGTYTKKLKY